MLDKIPVMHAFVPISLNTERLALRFIEAGDAQAQFDIFSDPQVMRYWSSAPWTTMAQADEAIAQALAGYASGDDLYLAIVLKASGEMIGTIKLYAFHRTNRRCDLGYALARAHWGYGYLAEAMRVALDYAFGELQLNRIEADIDPRNTPSEKLLERMGFQKEGYMRERWIVNGEICDTAFYGLLQRDWKARSLYS